MTFNPAVRLRKLRFQDWFKGTSKDSIDYRCWMKNQGLPADLFDERLVIGILNNCGYGTDQRCGPCCATGHMDPAPCAV